MALPIIFGSITATSGSLSQLDQNFNALGALVPVQCSASGTNAIVLTANANQPTVSSYANYLSFLFIAAATSTAPVTIKFGSLAALNAYGPDGSTQITTNDLTIGRMYIFYFNSALNGGLGGFTLMSLTPTTAVVVGAGVYNPGGRITLATGTPVMITAQAAKTTIFYTPYIDQFVPLYNGSSFTMTDVGGELSQATTDTTKSPAAVAANSMYDMFVWNDGGTFRCTRGPAWTNDTTRASGLTVVNGIALNTSSITNGPAAQRGTWVGTVGSNGSSQIDWIYGGAGAGGGAASLNVWNAYNRVSFGTTVQETTASWTYGTNAFRSVQGSANNKVTLVRGADEDIVVALHKGSTVGAINVTGGAVAVGLDVTNAVATLCTVGYSEINTATDIMASWIGLPGLGRHTLNAIENLAGSPSVTFLSTGGNFSGQKQGFSVQFRA